MRRGHKAINYGSYQLFRERPWTYEDIQGLTRTSKSAREYRGLSRTVLIRECPRKSAIGLSRNGTGKGLLVQMWSNR